VDCFQRFQIVSFRLEVFVADEVLSILDVHVGKEHTFCVDLQCVGEEEHWLEYIKCDVRSLLVSGFHIRTGSLAGSRRTLDRYHLPHNFLHA